MSLANNLLSAICYGLLHKLDKVYGEKYITKQKVLKCCSKLIIKKDLLPFGQDPTLLKVGVKHIYAHLI
jgi:hypothetical protein